MGNINICHLNGKLDELKLNIMLSDTKTIYILGVCETFLDKKTPDFLINIQGFATERRDRKDKQGGGIVVNIADKLAHKEKKDIEIENVEKIWIEINLKNSKSILVCSAYMPPSSKKDWLDDFAMKINKASSSTDTEVLIFGDFNKEYKYPDNFHKRIINPDH